MAWNKIPRLCVETLALSDTMTKDWRCWVKSQCTVGQGRFVCSLNGACHARRCFHSGVYYSPCDSRPVQWNRQGQESTAFFNVTHLLLWGQPHLQALFDLTGSGISCRCVDQELLEVMPLKSFLTVLSAFAGKGASVVEWVWAEVCYSAGNPVTMESLLCAGQPARYGDARNLISPRAQCGEGRVETKQV